jgi:hypothetical protein
MEAMNTDLGNWVAGLKEDFQGLQWCYLYGI